MFWEVCASVFVLLCLGVFISGLFHALWRSLRITIPFYRLHRRNYFRIVEPKSHPSYQSRPTYVAPEIDSLSPDPDAEEDEFL